MKNRKKEILIFLFFEKKEAAEIAQYEFCQKPKLYLILRDSKIRKRTYQWYAFAILQGINPLDPLSPVREKMASKAIKRDDIAPLFSSLRIASWRYQGLPYGVSLRLLLDTARHFNTVAFSFTAPIFRCPPTVE